MPFVADSYGYGYADSFTDRGQLHVAGRHSRPTPRLPMPGPPTKENHPASIAI